MLSQDRRKQLFTGYWIKFFLLAHGGKMEDFYEQFQKWTVAHSTWVSSSSNTWWHSLPKKKNDPFLLQFCGWSNAPVTFERSAFQAVIQPPSVFWYSGSLQNLCASQCSKLLVERPSLLSSQSSWHHLMERWAVPSALDCAFPTSCPLHSLHFSFCSSCLTMKPEM